MGILELLILLVSYLCGRTSASQGQEYPIQGVVQDICSKSQYTGEQGDCLPCPDGCGSCYLQSNQELTCSSCSDLFFYIQDTLQTQVSCVNSCPVGYRQDASLRQCIPCGVRFCDDCSYYPQFQCNRCQNEYEYDNQMNLCMKSCVGQQLYDTLSGQCVNQCSEDKMTYKNTCISSISCPQKQTIQDKCSISSISQVIPHPDGNSIIAVGIKYVNILNLPDLILLKTHTIINAYSIVECKILTGDLANMYCVNSAQQIVRFSLSNLTETIIFNSKGYFHGESSIYPGYWEDNIIVANSKTIIEKTNILTGVSQTVNIPPGIVLTLYSVTYWKDRDLVATVIQQSDRTYRLLLAATSQNVLKMVQFTGTNKFISYQRITSIDFNQVIFHTTNSMIYCQVNAQNITVGTDFTCVKAQVVPFTYSVYNDLKVFKLQGIIIVFSSNKNILSILDCSISFQAIKVLTTITGVTQYYVQNNFVFIITTSSTVKVVSLVAKSTGMTFSINQSMMIMKSYTSKITGIVFGLANKIFLYDTYEIFSVDLLEQQQSNPTQLNIGQLSNQTLLDIHSIPISQSSKCELSYLPDIKLDIYREQSSTGFIILILQYKVSFTPIVSHLGYAPFEISFNSAEGTIDNSHINYEHRKFVVFQTNTISIIDIVQQKIIFQLLNYASYQCKQQSFINDVSFSIVCFDSTYYSDTLTIVTFDSAKITKIPFPSGRLFRIQKYPVQYFYYYENGIVSKYNSTGNYLSNFTGITFGAAPQMSFLDNDIQVIYFSYVLKLYDLISQTLISTQTIPNQYTSNPIEQVILFRNQIKGIFATALNTITVFTYPRSSGSATQQTYSCPGGISTLQYLQYYQNLGIVVYQSPTEALLCVIDLQTGSIQYLENEDTTVQTGSFSSNNHEYLYISRKGRTEIFQKQSAQVLIPSTSNKFLVKFLDLQYNCKEIKEYDKNTGICRNVDAKDAIFFPLVNEQSIDTLSVDFEVIRFYSQNIFFVLIGKQKVILSSKQDLLFSYEKTTGVFYANTIKEVYFDEDSREILIVWEFIVVEHINTRTNELINSFQSERKFLAFSPKLRVVVFHQLLEEGEMITVFSLNQSVVSLQILVNSNYQYMFKSVLDSSGEVVYLLRNDEIMRLNLVTGEWNYKKHQSIASLPIQNIIPTDKTLILMEANLKNGYIFDSQTLSLLSSPVLPSDQANNSKTYKEVVYSVAAVSNDWKYLILDVSYLQKIVILNIKDLSVIQTIQYHSKYIILDIDMENQLICTFSTDSLILIYEYSVDIYDYSNILPLYSISFQDYIHRTTNFKGVTFLSNIKGKIISKYQLLITTLDNVIRIHSLADGLLRFLIEDRDLVVEDFMIYLNNYLIVYGNSLIKVFNIEHALFVEQNVLFMPLAFKTYAIPIGNDQLLSDQELSLLEQPFNMNIFNSNEDDNSWYNTMCSIGEKVSLIDERYPILIDSQTLLQQNDSTTVNMNLNNQSVLFEPHKIYYISQINILNGIQGSKVFKRILLANETSNKSYVKYFFVSRLYVTLVKTDYITVFNLNLTTKSTFQCTQGQIKRILAVPSEINADRFIFLSNDQTIQFFDLGSNSLMKITIIPPSRGSMSYYFFLEQNSSRILVLGFADNSICTIDLDSFIGIWIEPSDQIPSQIFANMNRIFASNRFMFLNDANRHPTAIPFTIKTTLNNLGQQESVISFGSIITISSIEVEQFFFDASRERIILFIRDSSFIHYAVVQQSTSTSNNNSNPLTYTFNLIKSAIIKPSFDSSRLQIHSQLNIYIFYGNMYILLIHAEEMKIKAFLSDSNITGAIQAVYALTSNTLIITTDMNIFTIIFPPPQKSITSMYFIANTIKLTQPTILFYRYKQEINFTSNINIILEGISQEGAFIMEYPIDLQNHNSKINCAVSFNFTSSIAASEMFLAQLKEIDKLNVASGQQQQTYEIDNFHMIFVDGTDNFYKYLNQKQYNYFRMQGQNTNSIFYILPSSDFLGITGNNLHLKNFLFTFLRFITDNLILNKYFTSYITLIMETIQFKQDNLGYYFTFHQISYVLMQNITYQPATFAQDPSVAPSSLFDPRNLLRYLQETEYSVVENNLLISAAATSYCTFWNATDKVELNVISIQDIIIVDFSSMFSFLDCENAVVQQIQVNGLQMKNRFYENQQVMLFIKITNAIVQDVIFQNIILNEVTLMRFHDISHLTIQNLTLTNITCSGSSSGNPQFILELLGVQTLRIQGMYFTDIKDCFLFSGQQYQLQNVLKFNEEFNFKDVMFQNVTFNNMNNQNKKLRTLTLLDQKNIQSPGILSKQISYSNSYLSRQLLDSIEPIKQFEKVEILTPSLFSVKASQLFIQNFKFSNFTVDYTTLITFKGEYLSFTQFTIQNIHLRIPSSLTYPSPAVSLTCETFIGNIFSIIDNSQLDITLIASSEAQLDELKVQNNLHDEYNYKGDISGLFSIISTPKLTIINSRLENNLGNNYSTGCLYLSSITEQISIISSIFINNTAMTQAGGGLAIYYSSHKNNTIFNTTFEDNKSPQHSGGGIYALTSDFQLENCTFINNSALIGGGIRLISNEYPESFLKSYNTTLKNNVYSANWAAIFGNDVGLYPVRIINSKDLRNHFNIDNNQFTSKYYIKQFKSGSAISDLSFAILDNQGRDISFNNFTAETTHQLVIDEISKFTFNYSTSNSKGIFIPQGSIAYNTTTNFFDIYLDLYITPPATETIRISSSVTYPWIYLNSKKIQSLKPLSFEIIVSSRLCEIGEMYQQINSVYQCLSCPEGKYSFIVPSLDDLNSVVCKICPPQALNCTQNKMNLLNGFWRESEISDEIFECSKLTMNCKAQDPTSKELCGQGSIGPKCQSCDIYGRLWGDSYSRFTDQSCKKCSQILFSYMMFMFLFGIVLAYILILVWQNCRAIERKIKAITIIKLGLVRMGRSAIFDQFTTLSKIFMNYLLFIFILTEMDFTMPSNIKWISVGGDPILNIINSMDCLLAKLNGMNIVYWRVIWVFLFAQLIATIITVVFLLAYFLLLKKLNVSSARRLSLYRSRKIQQAEISTFAVKGNQENQISVSENVKEMKLFGDVNDEINKKEKVKIDENKDKKEDVIMEAHNNDDKHNNLEDNQEKQHSNGNDCECSNKKKNMESSLKNQQQQLKPQEQDPMKNIPKGSINALLGDEHPVELEHEDYLNGDNKLTQKSRDSMIFGFEMPSNLQFKQKQTIHSDEKCELINLTQSNHGIIEDEVNVQGETSQNCCVHTTQNNLRSPSFIKGGQQDHKINNNNNNNCENNPFSYSGLLNNKDKFTLNRLQKEQINENDQFFNKNSQLLMAKSQLIQKLNKSQKLNIPQSSSQKIIASNNNNIINNSNNSQPLFLGRSSGLEISANVPYFRVHSKYFQWYSGYIWMSLKLLFFYLQPGIVKMLLSVLSCVKIGTKEYIYADTQFLCDAEYRIVSIAAILPVLLIFCFVIPLIMFRKLKSNQKKQSSYTFLKSYGFFFQEYKSKAYYWEIFRMTTKTMISCVLVFFSSEINLKLILAILIISFYIFLQLRVQPYKTRSFNELDYLSNAVVVMSLILGLLIASTDILWLRILAGFSMFGINALFVWRICKEILLTIQLPWEEERRTFIHRVLYFLYQKIPYLFGKIAIQKPYSCKIFIMWNKLSLYVHLHKDQLIQQSISQKNLEEAKSLLLGSLKIDPQNEFNLLDNYENENIIKKHPNLEGISENNLRIFNENMLQQLKKISNTLNSTLQRGRQDSCSYSDSNSSLDIKDIEDQKEKKDLQIFQSGRQIQGQTNVEDGEEDLFKKQNRTIEMTLFTPSLERISSNNTFKFMSQDYIIQKDKSKEEKQQQQTQTIPVKVEQNIVQLEGNEEEEEDEVEEEKKEEFESDLFSQNCMKSSLDENKEIPSLHGQITYFQTNSSFKKPSIVKPIKGIPEGQLTPDLTSVFQNTINSKQSYVPEKPEVIQLQNCQILKDDSPQGIKLLQSEDQNIHKVIRSNEGDVCLEDTSELQHQEWQELDPTYASQMDEMKNFEEKKLISTFQFSSINQISHGVSIVNLTDKMQLKNTKSDILTKEKSPLSAGNSQLDNDTKQICSEDQVISSSKDSQDHVNSDNNNNNNNLNSISQIPHRIMQNTIYQTNQSSNVAITSEQNQTLLDFTKILLSKDHKSSSVES